MTYIDVQASVEGLTPAIEFIQGTLDSQKMNDNSTRETVLIFEELFTDIIENGSLEDDTVRLSFRKSFGNMRFYLSFFGDRFSVDLDSGDAIDPHVAILRSYEDRYSFNYRRRNNTITIECKGTHSLGGKVAISCVIIAAAYIIMYELLSPGQLAGLRDTFIRPVIDTYITAVVMISAPVTFFSLVKNISDVSVTLDRRYKVKKTIFSVALISLCGILTAIAFYMLVGPVMDKSMSKYQFVHQSGSVEQLPGIVEILENIVPADIVEAFTVINPVPLIFLAIITAVSICSMDKYFPVIKSINDSLYTLFCKMLSIVMWVIPFIAILAVLSLLINMGPSLIVVILFLVVLAAVSVLTLMALRLLMLKTKGVKIVQFIKDCLPMIAENFAINSSIDAVPFNTRFCNSVFKIKKHFLDTELPVLAQISLCGNCLIITLFSLTSARYFGISLSPTQVLIVGFLVLALSVGAPNQPGSVFIGMAILFTYFQVPVEGMVIIVLQEIVLGRFATLLNTVSDIITVYSHELDRQKKNKKILE